ncbi:hypothetical protein [Thermococcus pacificus]|uniref:Uncharacterized protein n=1 Tax=Thermococcus pacificus TaxID=71998 RepID=A0A218P6Y5_9EURY|nr:hypothetical protein [Thermococcus pacificus]ASJ06539.1 hypothetical protein A3L08_03945 [Thermococcus pacificus]
MDELEFCIKSLSYPIGMLLEKLEKKPGEFIHVVGGKITLPEVPFAALCYLTGIALFDSLDMVDKKRLSGDYDSIVAFGRKLLDSKSAEGLRTYLKSPGRYISPGERLSIDWLEFERRAERVRPYLRRVVEVQGKGALQREFLEKAAFLSELTVDEGLLLGYIAEDEKLRGLINAALGRHNPEFKAAVLRYFKALRG